jgi:hypothetical protein
VPFKLRLFPHATFRARFSNLDARGGVVGWRVHRRWPQLIRLRSVTRTRTMLEKSTRYSVEKRALARTPAPPLRRLRFRTQHHQTQATSASVLHRCPRNRPETERSPGNLAARRSRKSFVLSVAKIWGPLTLVSMTIDRGWAGW